MTEEIARTDRCRKSDSVGEACRRGARKAEAERVRKLRNLDVPMMILDPQENPQQNYDVLPVTDQNERLARQHPRFIVHRIYRDSGHNILRGRPAWFVRDALDLLDRVRRKPARRRSLAR